MKLSSLEKYNDIVIQMHDNPDADAVGSGYAMYKYFSSKNKNVRLVYGGNYEISKSNIIILIKELEIPVEYMPKGLTVKGTNDIYKPELLIMVDCQYGEGNATRFEAENIVIIDHHNTGRESDDMCEIRSHLASCSTICYDLLKKEGMDINKDLNLATALYYGLFMDSNGFAELNHPLERDMIDFLRIDKSLIKRLVHSNFTIGELETAGIALIRYSYDEHKHFSIIKSKPCDPNILGLIGDLVLQVDTIDVCIIYNECQEGYKLSVRSCVSEVAANDLAKYLTEDIGNGGGHNDKAGGFISVRSFEKVYRNLGIETYFFDRMSQYYENYDVIHARNGIGDKKDFVMYSKKPIERGYIRTTDLADEGETCKLRTLEGDVIVNISKDIYIMIGSQGEAYPIERTVFEKKYSIYPEDYKRVFEYAPILRNLHANEEYFLMDYAKKCVCREDTRVFAKRLEKSTKVFTKWDYEGYMLGNVGDFICYPEDDDKDIYIVNKNLFDEIYERK